jgi:hypothetical protein
LYEHERLDIDDINIVEKKIVFDCDFLNTNDEKEFHGTVEIDKDTYKIDFISDTLDNYLIKKEPSKDLWLYIFSDYFERIL